MSGKIGRSGRPPEEKPKKLDRDVEIFFRRLNFLLISEKMSARQMAEETGICRDSLYYHKRNNTMPSGDQVLKLCRYFRVSADWLMGLSNDIAGKCRF